MTGYVWWPLAGVAIAAAWIVTDRVLDWRAAHRARKHRLDGRNKQAGEDE